MITEEKEKGKVYIGFTFTPDYINLPSTLFFTYGSEDEIKLYKDTLISMIASDNRAKILSKILGFSINSNMNFNIPFLFKGDIFFLFDLEYDYPTEKAYRKLNHNKELSEKDIKDLNYKFLKIYVL
ncbi:MAG: hypothetical protein QXV17_14345 [Candidatus Micrarchaeaceae archaeon]